MDSYDNLKTAIANWLNREGFTALEDMAGTFLDMAQRKVFRECDLKCMEATATGTTADPYVPSDFLRTKALYITNGSTTQEVTGGSYHNTLPRTGTNTPIKYSLVGSQLVFSPSPDQEYDWTLIYYKSLQLLSDSNTTNWFTINNPELLLFGALAEASLFLKDDVRTQVWEQRFVSVKEAQEKSDLRADKEYGGMAVRMAN